MNAHGIAIEIAIGVVGRTMAASAACRYAP